MTLVFIHGSGGDAGVWRHQTEQFADAVAVSLPGHPDGEPLTTMPEIAAWLHDELERREVAAPVVVGHSLGGGVAIQTALDHPGSVRGLVLVGSGARLRVHPATLAAVEGFVAGEPGFADMFAGLYDRVEPGFGRELLDRMLEIGPATLLADFTACDRFDVMDRLDELTLPVLAIVGSDDVMTPPKYSQFLADRLDNVDTVVIDGATHFVFAEKPAEVNRAIEDFLTRLP